MANTSKEWLRAAEKYNMAKNLFPENDASVPTLRGFLESEEGAAARKLLTSADEYIILGNNGNKSLVLGKAGLKMDESGEMKSIHFKDASKFLEIVRKHNPGYEPIAEARRQLDIIAEKAP